MHSVKSYQINKLRINLDQSMALAGFWNFWKWKLEPFSVSDKIDTEYELNICRPQAYADTDDWKTVSDKMMGFFHLEVSVNSSGDTLWKYSRKSTEEDIVCLLMNAGLDQIQILYDYSETSAALPFELIGQMVPLVLLKQQILTFHGVLMEHDGRGIIISAPSGIGKTTHARLWRDNKNALIINGDRAACVKENGKWIGFGIPWSGSSGEQINRSVPITAMVVLRQSENNYAERLNGLDAFEAVMPNLLYPTWDKELTEKALDLTDDFLSEIPVIRLHCRPDAESVEVLDQALQEL